MSNKEKLRRALELHSWGKTVAVTQKRVASVLPDIDLIVISDLDLIEAKTEVAYTEIRKQQKLGNSFQYKLESDALKHTEDLIEVLKSERLLIILRIEESYCAIELNKDDTGNNISALWDLSEGDLVIAQPYLDNGISLELDHYYYGDEYEVTSW